MGGFAPSGNGLPSGTLGDMLYFDGSSWVTLPIGTAGYFLNVDVSTGLPTWTLSSASVSWGSITGTLSSQTDLNNALNGLIPKPTTPPTGALLYYDGSNWVVLGQGNSGEVLKSNGSGGTPTWLGLPVPIVPSGTNYNIQYYNSGNLGASGNFTYDPTNEWLGVGISSPSTNGHFYGTNPSVLIQANNSTGQAHLKLTNTNLASEGFDFFYDGTTGYTYQDNLYNGGLMIHRVNTASGSPLTTFSEHGVNGYINIGSTSTPTYRLSVLTNAFGLDDYGNQYNNCIPSIQLGGISGQYEYVQPFRGSTYKKIAIFFNNYSDSGTSVINFLQNFTNTPYVYGDPTILALLSSVSINNVIFNPITPALTGFIFVEGW